MTRRKPAQFLAPDARMLDIKRRAGMPGGCAETEIPHRVEDAVVELESRFEPLLQEKLRRMAELVSGDDGTTAASAAEELRWLAKDMQSTAPVFGYHGAGEMAGVLADTVDRLGLDEAQVRSFCKWQVDALTIVIRSRARGPKPQDVADTIRDARQALDKLARRRSGRP